MQVSCVTIMGMSLDIKMVLKEAKLKITPARLDILSLFAEKCLPLSAELIMQKVSTNKKIDEVTIYRTLASLEKAKIIQRVDLRQESVFYELTDHHHHHLVCLTCGCLEKINGCEVKPIVQKALKKAKNFKRIESHAFEIFGYCRHCDNLPK